MQEINKNIPLFGYIDFMATESVLKASSNTGFKARIQEP